MLSQVAVFRLDPWEGQACPNGSWSAADQASYRTWINNFATAIGFSRVALVLQPDLAFAGSVTNPRVCRNRYDRICATLGIPPTTDVADARWGLSASDRRLAARFADAYLWVGRPWLDNGAYPFDLNRALGMAASTPW